METKAKVFVSGVTGFVAGHIVQLLLQRGYQVVGSVRSLKNQDKLRHLRQMQPQKNLTLVEASLTDKDIWVKHIEGCDYVIHTASPAPLKLPKNPDEEVIKPAIQGTESIFYAAIKNNVKKIVLTSSGVCMFSGVDNKNFFTENDWSNLKRSPPYESSKHLAEKKAWEIIKENKRNGGNMELSVINPLFIQGPASSGNSYASGDVINQLMTGKMPGLAKVSMGYVDVREVALAHVNAMERDQANGKRYLLVENSYWLEDVATILRAEFGQYGYKVPSTVFGKCMISIAGMFDPTAKLMKPYVGRLLMFDNTASINDLGVQYRSVRETLLDTVYQQIENKSIPSLLPANHRYTHRTNKYED